MEKLKRLRTERNLSQTKLAQLADLNPATVNQIEKGAREPSTATLRKLAEALDVSVAELLEDEAPKAQAPLPFEGEEGQRRRPSFEAWTSYMNQRVQAWEQALAEEGDAPFGETEDVHDALIRSEQVQIEAMTLLTTVHREVFEAAPPDAPKNSQEDIAAILLGDHEPQRVELVKAIMAVMRVSDEWGKRAVSAWKAVADRVEARKLARARERAEDAARERQKVAELFPVRDTA